MFDANFVPVHIHRYFVVVVLIASIDYKFDFASIYYRFLAMVLIFMTEVSRELPRRHLLTLWFQREPSQVH